MFIACELTAQSIQIFIFLPFAAPRRLGVKPKGIADKRRAGTIFYAAGY
jgi:hypothetical protein